MCVGGVPSFHRDLTSEINNRTTDEQAVFHPLDFLIDVYLFLFGVVVMLMEGKTCVCTRKAQHKVEEWVR